MSKNALLDRFMFPGQMVPTAHGSNDNTPWRSSITKTSGTPTVAAAAGQMVMSLDATSEAQTARLSHDDVLSYPWAQLKRLRFWASAAALGGVANAVFGIATAGNNTYTSVSKYAFFVAVGNTTLLIYAKDGTNTYSAVATGQLLTSTTGLFVIDFAEGLSDVRFYSEDSNGNLRRLAPKTTFNLGAATGSVQPYFQVNKATGTDASTLSVQRLDIEYQQS